MATITHGISTANNGDLSSYTSNAFTPATDDLLVVFVSAADTVAAGAVSGSTGLTFTKVTSALFNSSAWTVYCFVADALATNTSQTVTFTCTGDASTGATIQVERIAGVTRTGLSAILQSAISENNAASTTPAATFASSALTGNPTLGVVGKASATAIANPASWTELADTGHSLPNARCETVGRASGFTGTTITWGASEDGAYGVIIVEIDTSSAGATYTLDVGAAAYDYTASDASLEFGRVLVPDAASYAYTANDVTLSRDMSIVPDAAAYTYTANDASLEFGRQIVIDTVSYDWTPTDVDLTYTPAGTTYNLIPDSAAYAWAASDVTFDYVSLASPYRSPSGSRPDYERRVRRKWEEIEEIERRIKAKEEAEREKISKQEEAKRQLAELEEKKRQTKTIAERKRKLEARIAAYQSEITELRQEMIALLEEIERARVEQELQQTIADRRRRMLLLLAVAA